MAYDSSKPANGGSLVSADIRENFRALKEDGIVVAADLVAAKKDPIATTAGLRTLGTGAQQACAGNDGRLSDFRIPVDASVSRSKLENCIAGEYLEVSTGGGTVGYTGVWQKIKEIYLPFGGTYRVRFDLAATDHTCTAGARIYKNGVAHGSAVPATSSTPVAYTQDISGWSGGDLLQLYLFIDAPNKFATTTYLRVYSGNPYHFCVIM